MSQETEEDKTIYKVVVNHEDFFSHYLPWSAVFEVAPGYVPAGASSD